MRRYGEAAELLDEEEEEEERRREAPGELEAVERQQRPAKRKERGLVTKVNDKVY